MILALKGCQLQGASPPDPHQGAPPPGPPAGGSAPLTPEITSPPLTIYPGAAPVHLCYDEIAISVPNM